MQKYSVVAAETGASFFVIFVVATLVTSRLTYRYFEAPAQDIIRRRLLLRSDVRASTAVFAASAPARPRSAD